MSKCLDPFRFLLISLAGWMNQQWPISTARSSRVVVTAATLVSVMNGWRAGGMRRVHDFGVSCLICGVSGTVALGNRVLTCDRRDSTAFLVFERSPLDFTRPASSAGNASFRDANRLTGAASVTVDRAAQEHRPMRVESRRGCLYAARRSYR